MRAERTKNEKGALARRRLVAKRTLPLFVRLGYEKVSFHDISAATGVPRTALYRYYRTKRQIFDASILTVVAGVRTEIEATCAKAGDSLTRLKAVTALVMDLLYRERDLVRVIFDFVFTKVSSGEDMARRVAAFTIGLKLKFRELVAAGQRDGLLRAVPNPDILAELLFAAVESAALKMLLGSEAGPEGGKRRLAAAVSAIAVEPGS